MNYWKRKTNRKAKCISKSKTSVTESLSKKKRISSLAIRLTMWARVNMATHVVRTFLLCLRLYGPWQEQKLKWSERMIVEIPPSCPISYVEIIPPLMLCSRVTWHTQKRPDGCPRCLLCCPVHMRVRENQLKLCVLDWGGGNSHKSSSCYSDTVKLEMISHGDGSVTPSFVSVLSLLLCSLQ